MRMARYYTHVQKEEGNAHCDVTLDDRRQSRGKTISYTTARSTCTACGENAHRFRAMPLARIIELRAFVPARASHRAAGTNAEQPSNIHVRDKSHKFARSRRHAVSGEKLYYTTIICKFTCVVQHLDHMHAMRSRHDRRCQSTIKTS
mmetsp:Transcript_16007/g.30383  ORF Transcript_16007/g.30383 Transcript_16007/m.30383 type:complete len:147 (+) Transcript_16007:857-1297(+)